ncbi:ArsR/SmtB family transcription factor [Devosia albogilva]|uniref:ArsR/SmtB family transcription factor n=1 Tax=Devosia albogilva TaxID=429726 RepID=A0ABW5QFB4_9HYPH
MSPVPVLVALADPVRCRIVEMLRAEAQPVHRIAAAFPISRPAISRHLKVLKRARLISEKKVGRENIYVLHPRRLEPVRKWLDGIHPAPVAATEAALPAEVAVPATPVAKPAPRKAARSVPAKTPAEPAPPPPVAATPKPSPKPALEQMGFDF